MTWQELYDEWMSDGGTLRCQTSGSTGIPKRIDLPKAQVRACAWRTIRLFGLNASSRLHSCLAPDYIGGKMMMVRALECSGTFSYEKPSNHPLTGWKEGRIDLLSVVPSQLRDMLARVEELPEIGDVLVGGSPLDDELRRRVAKSPLRVWETYGMTETASHIAVRRVTWPVRPFYPLEGIKVSAEDTDHCLVIEIEGWSKFRTNDIMEIYPDGGFTILGRADNVIITGGLKVHPEAVEAILQPLLPFPVMISSRPDPKWGERVVLIAENPSMSGEEILEVCRGRLQRHEVPKEIIFGVLPRTESGKLKRR